uniref:Uncharacterized protein n=1 Tax=Arundo donax TaxID=35708 RepID=A0A0A9FHF5_ARUDO
MKIQEFPGDL